MKIKEITRQFRRDFVAIFVCENCQSEIKLSGYDDRNFHDNVIPAMVCQSCGKSRKDLGIVPEKTPTKYPEGLQI